MTELKVLRVLHGDAFVLEVTRDEDSFVMVIDGGPKKAFPSLKKELDELPKIDMLVLTHSDADHIGGILSYIRDAEERCSKIVKFWLNTPHLVKIPESALAVSYRDSITLFERMAEIESKAGHQLDWRERIVRGCEYTDPKGLVHIKVLAPTEDVLKANEEWLKKKEKVYLEKKGLMMPLSTSESSENGNDEDDGGSPLDTPLEDLVEEEYNGVNIVNRSSIVMLIETWDGSTLLMGGDSDAASIVEGIKNLKDSDGNLIGYSEEKPLDVDLFKIPHHGSRKNISNSLLGLVRTTKYLISTNGGSSKKERHPGRETIAKILLHPRRDKKEKIEIILNHSLREFQKRGKDFINKEEIENPEYNFTLCANQDSETITLLLNDKSE